MDSGKENKASTCKMGVNIKECQ